ncbi:MAG: hypothetical protein JRH20_12570 [Deltaproteobacteria bacterium]|nr:hypothetical protein [Deltaproteobacteria bacterium]
MRTILCLIVTAVFVMGAPALAANNAKKKPSYQVAPQHLTFEPDVIRAGRRAPEGSVIRGERSVPQTSLIPMRKHFLAELIKSAENL